ncbi:2097_t:CDS:10 [Diversispora eburnea]|uniref:2097_t:CDS:1 n=1 Tax=Diversispora eburnea TaxID=1213867 RepID=A0A9N8ZWI2_9GLOM|nr:2097_t:CDS:10 [Diversispora eburnea]
MKNESNYHNGGEYKIPNSSKNNIKNSKKNPEIPEIPEILKRKRVRRLNEKGEATLQPVKVQRYWPDINIKTTTTTSFNNASGTKKVHISEREVAADRRRQRLRERALERRRQEEERLKELETAEKNAEATQIVEENMKQILKMKMIKQQENCLSQAHRETILEREKIEKLAEEAETMKLKEREERKQESHMMVASVVQKEKQKEFDEEASKREVEDIDGIDEQAEYEAWKLRELKRIKTDREERRAEKEREEIEKRRNMSEEQRMKEDMNHVKKQREEKTKGKYMFLQKYYHKGAFYLDKDEDIFKRNYAAPTPDEAVRKEVLPKVMQVKNFGRAGQTKWTHLADQDTTKKDSVWSKNTPINRSTTSKLGGLHGGFDKPTSKKRKTE